MLMQRKKQTTNGVESQNKAPQVNLLDERLKKRRWNWNWTWTWYWQFQHSTTFVENATSHFLWQEKPASGSSYWAPLVHLNIQVTQPSHDKVVHSDIQTSIYPRMTVCDKVVIHRWLICVLHTINQHTYLLSSNVIHVIIGYQTKPLAVTSGKYLPSASFVEVRSLLILLLLSVYETETSGGRQGGSRIPPFLPMWKAWKTDKEGVWRGQIRIVGPFFSRESTN